MTTDAVKIRLSSGEASYLSGAAFLKAHQIDVVRKREPVDQGGAILKLSRDLVEEFREAFTEQLARVGFDQNYDVTPEGRVLEELIDRFFLE